MRFGCAKRARVIDEYMKATGKKMSSIRATEIARSCPSCESGSESCAQRSEEMVSDVMASLEVRGKYNNLEFGKIVAKLDCV
ncbi:MAG: hypothetical protein JRN20_11135 [Nitrososphaerota archaeon]|nr:hypothetical protein [Nitrososphaerota archaeon]